MKRYIFMAAIFALTLGLVACGGKKKEEAKPAAQPAAQAPAQDAAQDADEAPETEEAEEVSVAAEKECTKQEAPKAQTLESVIQEVIAVAQEGSAEKLYEAIVQADKLYPSEHPAWTEEMGQKANKIIETFQANASEEEFAKFAELMGW